MAAIIKKNYDKAENLNESTVWILPYFFLSLACCCVIGLLLRLLGELFLF